MTTLEEAFEEFKKLPDWERFPMPEVFYQHFNLKKPQPSESLMESLTYTPPPHQSLNKRGKVEILPPVEGGVRPMPELLELPVEVKKVNEKTLELEDFPPVPEQKPYPTYFPLIPSAKTTMEIPAYLEHLHEILKDQTDDDTKQDSAQTTLSRPIEDSNSEILPGWDHQSLNPFYASPDTAPSGLYHDVECSPPSQQPQNGSS